jgi:hypothetical protein
LGIISSGPKTTSDDSLEPLLITFFVVVKKAPGFVFFNNVTLREKSVKDYSSRLVNGFT